MPAAGHLNGHIGAWQGHEEMDIFYYEMGAMDVIREAYAEQGVHQVGPVSYSGLTLWGNRPLRTVADFEGWPVALHGGRGPRAGAHGRIARVDRRRRAVPGASGRASWTARIGARPRPPGA